MGWRTPTLRSSTGSFVIVAMKRALSHQVSEVLHKQQLCRMAERLSETDDDWTMETLCACCEAIGVDLRSKVRLPCRPPPSIHMPFCRAILSSSTVEVPRFRGCYFCCKASRCRSDIHSSLPSLPFGLPFAVETCVHACLCCRRVLPFFRSTVQNADVLTSGPRVRAATRTACTSTNRCPVADSTAAPHDNAADCGRRRRRVQAGARDSGRLQEAVRGGS